MEGARIQEMHNMYIVKNHFNLLIWCLTLSGRKGRIQQRKSIAQTKYVLHLSISISLAYFISPSLFLSLSHLLKEIFFYIYNLWVIFPVCILVLYLFACMFSWPALFFKRFFRRLCLLPMTIYMLVWIVISVWV